ncbi:MAG: hypothetical protein AAFX58_03135 [Pseudomonadota bacterium]
MSFARPQAAETLWSDGTRGLTLRVSQVPHMDAARLLAATVFGGDGVRYRRLGTAGALAALAPALHVSLLAPDGRLLGHYSLAERRLHLLGEPVDGFYRGFLAIDRQAQRQGYGHLLVEKTLNWLHARARDADSPLLTYGCIERSNGGSLKLLQTHGATLAGSLEGLFVYRQWPRGVRDLRQIEIGENDAYRAQYLQTVGDCGLAAPVRPGSRVWTTAGDPVAGATVSLTRLAFERIGGAWDMLARSLFRLAPPARRRFDPDDFRYLTLAAPLVRAGHEREWPRYLESLMAGHDVHMAMLMLDPDSALAGRLRGAGVFGVTARLLRERFEVPVTTSHPERHDLARAATMPLSVNAL